MSDFTTVEEYINSFSGRTKSYLEQLRAIIHKTVPNTTEIINYNIATFTLVAGGKREEQIMMAGYKNHIGFYPHPTTVKYFWDELDGYKKAKGSVQFSLNKPLPQVLIEKMINYRIRLLTSTLKN